ncbi:hypothetical protein [Bradyrhizobium sp. STM 3557]|uniref:hypothetical protein n=1 Tax=Bradyrhizobium sp. STM 3557 TaxID=578920 RepID=UPI003890E228
MIDPSDYVFAGALALVVGCNTFLGTRLMRESTNMDWSLTGKSRSVCTDLARSLGRTDPDDWRAFFDLVRSIFTPPADLGVQISIIVFWVIFVTAHISMLLKAR